VCADLIAKIARMKGEHSGHRRGWDDDDSDDDHDDDDEPST